MKNIFLTLYLIMAIILLGCSLIDHSSPLKSNLEVEFNKKFGTNFQLLDKIELYTINDKKYALKSVITSEDIILLFLQAENTKYQINKVPSYKLLFTTSEENKEYTSNHEAYEMIYFADDQVICDSNQNCYKITDKLATILNKS